MPIPQAVAAKEKTQQANKELSIGLKYIPDDKLTWVPAGKAKPPLQIVADCAAAYRWAAATIRGAPAGPPEQKVDASPTRADAVERLEAGLADLVAALDEVTEEQSAQKRQMPWGEETVANLMWLGHWHSIYHAGQLNYIQTLLGDTEMHFE